MKVVQSTVKLAITGASGQLGQELINLSLDGVEIIGFTHQDLDVTDFDAVDRTIISLKPDVIINAAAFTDVEKAELSCELAHRVNGLGAENLACAANTVGAALIHISTDYVFDGKKQIAYCETDTPNPINQYGKSKMSGEQAVISHCQRHIIVRSSSLFSAAAKNFCRTMLQLGVSRSVLNIVSDQVSGPTSAADLAKGIMIIAKEIRNWPASSEKWGIYHFCGEPLVSWFQLAKQVVQSQSNKVLIAPNLTINPIQAKDYQSYVERPAFSGLDNSKINKVFGIKPSNWQHALTEIDFKL
ncbi:dTDP-4-dehydrorhamnose reductase [Parashewanella spongiae]|uniref:dTDP-4-dehydrorhamnose reductase n=1 Tax=Parashewanella spongiae TaxID=342950 RepID=A0A3A6TYD1_9GAMM|nr:dTDP-4-dehydrorhamnose reductase [Parashewanella spongiae]MCL1077702.1 dTDP-4-dehydrorhamnose reductase [Parashewanella spongiae]RJY18102.1 dTDP-4-dehydrorhamnose reductase [Parashewanella spongiae]